MRNVKCQVDSSVFAKMSINETEFVDIGKKFLNNDLNIKVESYCGDGRNPEDDFSASESKCGDIFHSTNGFFVFCCYYCSERFAAIEEFVSHYEGKHSNTLITTKRDETLLTLRKVDKTNEYLGSEASETLPWITDNPIKIEENLDSGNCVSTDLFNEDETNVEKTPKVYSEKEIQCPKCPYTFRWKNDSVYNLCQIHKDYSGSLAKRAIRNSGDNIESRIKIVKVQGNVDESVISEWPETHELGNVEVTNPIINSCKIEGSYRQDHKTCQIPSLIELELTDGYKNSIGNENSIIRRPIPYKCSKCGKTFRLKHQLIRHFMSHTVELPFPCSHCVTAFKLKSELVLHLQKNHSSNSTEGSPAIPGVEKPFKCRICPKQFALSRSLKEHETVHTGERPFKCTHCAETFYIKRSFQRHIQNKHGIVKEQKVRGTVTKTKIPTRPQSLKCGFCGEVLSTVELRVAHEKSHTPECKICLKTFKTKPCLDQHKAIHTGRKSFKCTECPLAFRKRSILIIHHKRVHLKEKNFSCDHCEKRFASNTGKKLHMRTHFNEKPYQCEECGKNFTTTGGLSFHKLHHTQTKRHSCKICQKSFYTTVDLRHHMPVHTKEKLFQCTVCQSKFTTPKHLRRYMKLHSGEKNYVCTICKKAYVRKDGLNLHMKSHGVVGNRKESAAAD